MNIKTLFASLILGSTLILSASAQHAESGDAGDMPETAQATGTDTTTALPSISGINDASDVDMYAIFVADPANFQADTIGAGSAFDTQLWLFDANGKGVKHDDDSGGNLRSRITAPAGMQAGLYYIAISRWNRDAIGCGGGLIWSTAANVAPNGPESGSRVNGWVNATAAGGVYVINLRGCNTAPVGDDPDDCPPPPRTWNENTDGGGDAGDLPGTAQIVSASDADPCETQVRISGTHDIDDVDMYVICITDPASFRASTVGGATWDTQLWLFRCDGTGVTFNDDSGGTLQSTITGQFITEPGTYLIAVSRYNRDALDADGNLIWNNTPFGTERQPDGPGAANPVASWSGVTDAGGAYTIAMQGAYFVDEQGCDEGPPCPEADTNGDCCVNDADLLVVLFSFGDFGFGLPGDLNGDFTVNDADLLIVLFAFGQGCE